MSCCCNNKLNIGCISTCKILEFNSVAPIVGVYILECDFLGTVQVIESDNLNPGDKIVFDISALNESFGFEDVKMFDPNSKRLNFTVNAVVYDCLKFKTVIGKRVNNIINAIIS